MIRKIKSFLLKWAIQDMIEKVVFDDETFMIELHLSTGEIICTQGDKSKWEVENLLSDLNIS